MCAVGLVVALGVATPAAANFPPVATATVSPAEIRVGAQVTFSSAGSFDTDAGPSPLTYRWDFADGFSSTEPEVTRTFSAAGAVRATLTVDDGQDSAVASAITWVLDAPVDGCCARSSPLAISRDGGRLWVVNPDSDSVTFIDTSTGVAVEVEVCADPRSVALDDDRGLVYVACREANALQVLDANGALVREVDVGHRPFGVTVVPASGRVIVAEEGQSSVRVLEPGASALVGIIATAAEPRAITVAADGKTAWVSHYLTREQVGQVTLIDVETLAVLAVTQFPEDPGPDTTSSGRGFPNLLGALAFEPSGRVVWVGGLKSNSASGPRLRGRPIGPTNWVRGFAGRIDVETRTESLARRLDTNNADSVSGIAFSPGGRFAYLTHQGAGTLSVYDVPAMALVDPSDGSSVPFVARIDVGEAPQGVVVAPAGDRLYVASYLSRAVVVVDITAPTVPVLLGMIATTAEPLADDLALGKRLFFRSNEPIHSKGNYVACASCHPDGGSDGRTWDTTQKGEGLRNTRDLRGHGTADGPLHWSANFDEVQDFENDLVHQFAGTGLAQDGLPPNPPLGPPNAGRSRELDALAEFVASLGTKAPRSPWREADGSLRADARRGKAIFEQIGCADCHAPPRFTDSTLDPDPARWQLWDIGTITPLTGERLGGPLVGLDTPSLIGAWASPPYLHDGRAATVRDVLTGGFSYVKAGLIADLSPEEIDDLVAYVMSIDGRPDEVDHAAGCGCSEGGRPSLPVAVGLLLFIMRGRGRARRHP